MQVTEMPLDLEYQHAEAQIDLFNAMATNLTNLSTSYNQKSSKNRPIFIEDDEGMTDEEKEMAFLEYMRHGYHHPSMIKIIEEKAALTSLELKSTKKINYSPLYGIYQSFCCSVFNWTKLNITIEKIYC